VTVVQTVLVFGAIPLGVVALLTLAVYGKSLVRQPNRYRPGKPWDYPPAWYVPHPDAVVARPNPSGSTTAVGGASGEW
jgi:hypothetical protein